MAEDGSRLLLHVTHHQNATLSASRHAENLRAGAARSSQQGRQARKTCQPSGETHRCQWKRRPARSRRRRHRSRSADHTSRCRQGARTTDILCQTSKTRDETCPVAPCLYTHNSSLNSHSGGAAKGSCDALAPCLEVSTHGFGRHGRSGTIAAAFEDHTSTWGASHSWWTRAAHGCRSRPLRSSCSSRSPTGRQPRNSCSGSHIWGCRSGCPRRRL